MSRLSLNRIVLFLCVVAAISVTIFGVQNHRAEQRRKAVAEVEEQARKAAAEVKRKADEEKAAATTRINNERNRLKALQAAAAEHERFLTKYVNTNLTKRAAGQMVAVAVVSENRSMNHAVGAALVTHFQGERVYLTDSFFKPELITDGLFESVFNGASDLFNRLELAKTLDALLLARQTVQYETNAALNNTVTAAMQLEVVTLPVAGHLESQSWTFSANGAGFRSADARMQAEERILKQIATDTKMVLTPHPR